MVFWVPTVVGFMWCPLSSAAKHARSVAPLSYAIAGSVLNPNGNYLLHSGMSVVIACVCHCLCLSLLPYLGLLVLQECLRNNTVNASATACNTLLRKDRVQERVADLRI